VEHIIPESLGNTEHILPVGVVCDKCNNYIAREVEKPLLDSLYFRERRFRAGIPNKEKRIPPVEGVHLQSRTPIQLRKSLGVEGPSIGVNPGADEVRWVQGVLGHKSGTLVIPISEKPSHHLVSRFIGKIGLEVLALRLMNAPGGLDEIVDNPGLEDLRRYVRMGGDGQSWPYSHRFIYPQEFCFNDGAELYEVLHEFDILVTTTNEHYIVVAIFGEEFALNLGGPELDGYERWLKANKNVSPLYQGKNV